MKKVLYHIHKKEFKDELWKVGNEIEIGKENNFFTDLSLNFTPLVFNDYEKNDLDSQLKIYKNITQEYQMLIRELGLEEVRKNFYPHLPSRQKCIWLCRKDQIDYWKQHLKGDVEIFEIEIYDEPFKSGNSFIPLPSDSYNDILKKARLYWEQNNIEDKEDDEYLYIGKVKIIKKVE